MAVLLSACATAPKPKQADELQGVASWYGEEFAGRTTANGEIFDPMQFTAAHRSLPFGTVVDVFNPKTEQSVRVRINDRGPYVGTRVIDLSYAAAKKIGLVEPGSGNVEIKVVTVGRGDREPPAPFVVEVDKPAETAPPQVSFPLPAEAAAATPSTDDFRIEVLEEKQGVVTRRQVSADGKRIEEVPIAPVPTPAPVAVPAPAPAGPGFVVQVGAFAVEANAKSLQARLSRIGQESYIDKDELFHVRIGPFTTREQAVRARTALETEGMSAIILTQ